jgi:hypothetical protein
MTQHGIKPGTPAQISHRQLYYGLWVWYFSPPGLFLPCRWLHPVRRIFSRGKEIKLERADDPTWIRPRTPTGTCFDLIGCSYGHQVLSSLFINLSLYTTQFSYFKDSKNNLPKTIYHSPAWIRTRNSCTSSDWPILWADMIRFTTGSSPTMSLPPSHTLDNLFRVPR